MGMCWIPGCTHYNNRETCTFFTFPKPETKEYAQWVKLIRRDAKPGPGARVCSCHFEGGLRENLPTKFPWNVGTLFQQHHLSPEKKKARTRVLETEYAVLPSTSKVQEADLAVNTEHCEPSVSTSTQSDPLPSTALLEAENYLLGRTVEELQQRTSSIPFSFDQIKHDNKLVLLYTGLPEATIFKSLFNLYHGMTLNYYHSTVIKIPKEDQLLMTLMKLRLNVPQKDLAVRFCCSDSVVSNIFITWIHALHEVLCNKFMAKIPTTKKNRTCLPSSFSTFSNCRIILDCTEVFTAVSRKSMQVQKSTYSTYKQRNTWKGLVGVAPNGVVTFVSKLYPGSTSDKKIVQHCGILQHLEAGDLILADKGFLIHDILPAGVSLNIPPFLTTSQFTEEQVRRTASIAKARVHVERAIRRMKCYSILNFIPDSLIPEASIVFRVVGALTNLQYPLIKEVEEYYITS